MQAHEHPHTEPTASGATPRLELTDLAVARFRKVMEQEKVETGAGVRIAGTGANDVEICSTARAGMAGTTGGTSTLLPSATRSAKGIRNLTDAASHSQYRVPAWLLLSAYAAIATSAVNSVDCQR